MLRYLVFSLVCWFAASLPVFESEEGRVISRFLRDHGPSGHVNDGSRDHANDHVRSDHDDEVLRVGEKEGSSHHDHAGSYDHLNEGWRDDKNPRSRDHENEVSHDHEHEVSHDHENRALHDHENEASHDHENEAAHDHENEVSHNHESKVSGDHETLDFESEGSNDHEAEESQDQENEDSREAPADEKMRLRILAERIDYVGDGDRYISADELEVWIEFMTGRAVRDDGDRQFVKYDKDKDGKIRWQEFVEVTYGFPSGRDDGELWYDSDYDRKMERRWKAADRDGDGACTAQEFALVLYAHHYDVMKPVAAAEFLETVDLDGDGFVDLDEYVRDATAPNPSAALEQLARLQFDEVRDRNGDGRLDLEEVSAWVARDGRDEFRAEADEVLGAADDDGDGRLSVGEVVAHRAVFAASKATNFGEMLARGDYDDFDLSDHD